MARSLPIRGWRKIAVATWGHPSDPQVYGDLEIDAGPLLAFIEEARRRTGVRVTMTHLVGRAVAHALGENPDLNGRLRWGRFVLRKSVDVFFIVSADEGRELSGVKIEGADGKGVVEIARELVARADDVRSAKDPEFGRTKKMTNALPASILGRVLRIAAIFATDLDLDLARVGLPRDPFGSAMISSVGMFGVQHAYAPLSPYYRIPILLLVGEVAERPVARDGRVVVRPMVTLSASIDHRYLDGYHAARLSRSARAYLEAPERFEPSFDVVAAALGRVHAVGR